MGKVSKTAGDLKRLYEDLRHHRGTWEGHWREVAKYVYPEADEFWETWQTSSKGDKKSYFIYDATAMLSNMQFANLLESLITPRDQRWHRMTMTDPTVMKDKQSRLWLDQLTDILFRKRYDAAANYQSQMSAAYLSIGSFGTGAMFTDRRGKGLRYKNIFIGDMYFDVNFQGIMDTAYRRFDYSHHQAYQRWGDDCPEMCKKKLEKEPYERSSYLHAVVPNTEHDPEAPDARRFRFLSMYIHLESGEELEASGYNAMPYACGRYQVAPHELYGRGPAMAVLPDIRTLNEMARADIRATHKAVDPPLLVHDDGILGSGRQNIFLDPGMVNFGGVSAEGRQLIQPLQTGARVDLNEAKMEVKRQVIKDAFLVSTFQILTETPRMTATEAMMRAQEKGALLAPVMGRVQSELLSPQIDRELDVLFESEELPPPPPIAAEALAEGNYEIVYESPLSRMQRAESMLGIEMVVNQAVALANVGKPEVLDSLNAEAIMRHVADGGGAPEDILHSAEEVAAIQQARQQQEQQMMQAEQAPQQAKALKELAQAEQISAETGAI